MKKIKILQNGITVRGKERKKGEVIRMFEGDSVDVLVREKLGEIVENIDKNIMVLMDKD